MRSWFASALALTASAGAIVAAQAVCGNGGRAARRAMPPGATRGGRNAASAAAKSCKQIRQLSVAELLAEAVRRIATGESVSTLYVD